MLIYIDGKSDDLRLELASAEKVIDEIQRIYDKFQRKVDKEIGKKHAELQAAMEYESLDDIHDAYGVGSISEEEYYRLTDLFEQGEAALSGGKQSKNERVCEILKKIIKDVASDVAEIKDES